MTAKRDKEKQKPAAQKQYQVLKSIYDQVEEELYCLKKEEQILMRLIEREEKRLKLSKKDQNQSSTHPHLYLEQGNCFELNSKHYGSLDVSDYSEDKERMNSRNQIPLESGSVDSVMSQNYFYTEHKEQETYGKRGVRKEDIFKMDEELYEEEDDDYQEKH